MIRDNKRQNPFPLDASDKHAKTMTKPRHIGALRGAQISDAPTESVAGHISLESLEGHTISILKDDLKRERLVD